MSLKSVEMQIAVPRTSEASRIQQEHHQRPTQDQSFLAGEHIKQSRQAAQRSTEIDETAESAVRDGGSGHSPEQGGDGHGQKRTGSGTACGASVQRPKLRHIPLRGSYERNLKSDLEFIKSGMKNTHF
ncbi:hypothetical protein [Paenibacillus sp. DMB20]|uniref:hypothetical protein n=1 Tax=Paenibacillus sp. DMB20 TaxID=1642570 RepID=UPI001F2A0BBA|nr:hypothetical protein [Paenibacillus sp. DMB20]